MEQYVEQNLEAANAAPSFLKGVFINGKSKCVTPHKLQHAASYLSYVAVYRAFILHGGH